MSEQVVHITPTENGPLKVEGPVRVTSPDGTIIKEADKVFLCRCGFSEKKPFCDGSHSRKNWQA
jgi:CDGSH-type Zn-finger protein